MFHLKHKFLMLCTDGQKKECARKEVPDSGDSLKKVIQPALEKIRFLSMTATEFSEGPAFTLLFSKSEKLSVLLKISCKTRQITIPEGFCQLSEPRKSYTPSTAEIRGLYSCSRAGFQALEMIFVNTPLQSCLSFSTDTPVSIIGFQLLLQEYSNGTYSHGSVVATLQSSSNNSILARAVVNFGIVNTPLLSIWFDKPMKIEKDQVYKFCFALTSGYYRTVVSNEAVVATPSGVIFTFKKLEEPHGLIKSILFSL